MLISSDTPFYFNAVATGVVIVSVLSPCAVDLGFEPQSGKTKDIKPGICCFPTKHAALRN
jgi:hypothetical protein